MNNEEVISNYTTFVSSFLSWKMEKQKEKQIENKSTLLAHFSYIYSGSTCLYRFMLD